MDDLERRITECLQRIHNFGTENASAISQNAVAVAAFAAIADFAAQLDETGALRTSAGLTKLTQTGRRRMSRTELYSLLLLMARNARAIERNDPDFINKFKLPRQNVNDATLLEAARSFHADSVPVKDDFIAYGLAGNFMETLQTSTVEFDEAINQQDTAKRNRIDANATIDDIIDRALTGRRTLLIVVPNLFVNNAGKLADWASASHIGRISGNPAPARPNP